MQVVRWNRHLKPLLRFHSQMVAIWAKGRRIIPVSAQIDHTPFGTQSRELGLSSLISLFPEDDQHSALSAP